MFFQIYIHLCFLFFVPLIVRIIWYDIIQVERFFTKAVEDLGNKLASLDPTVPIRTIISERAEQAEAMVDSHGTDESEPWVMRGSTCAPHV